MIQNEYNMNNELIKKYVMMRLYYIIYIYSIHVKKEPRRIMSRGVALLYGKRTVC